jgi:hypothetical protein
MFPFSYVGFAAKTFLTATLFFSRRPIWRFFSITYVERLGLPLGAVRRTFEKQ